MCPLCSKCSTYPLHQVSNHIILELICPFSRFVPIQKLPTCLIILEQSFMQSSCRSGVRKIPDKYFPQRWHSWSTGSGKTQAWLTSGTAWDSRRKMKSRGLNLQPMLPILRRIRSLGSVSLRSSCFSFVSGTWAVLPQGSEVTTNRSWKWTYPSHGNLLLPCQTLLPFFRSVSCWCVSLQWSSTERSRPSSFSSTTPPDPWLLF